MSISFPCAFGLCSGILWIQHGVLNADREVPYMICWRDSVPALMLESRIQLGFCNSYFGLPMDMSRRLLRTNQCRQNSFQFLQTFLFPEYVGKHFLCDSDMSAASGACIVACPISTVFPFSQWVSPITIIHLNDYCD